MFLLGLLVGVVVGALLGCFLLGWALRAIEEEIK